MEVKGIQHFKYVVNITRIQGAMPQNPHGALLAQVLGSPYPLLKAYLIVTIGFDRDAIELSNKGML